MLQAGRPVLLNFQCRIAYLEEALVVHGVTTGKVVLVECTRHERETRLDERGSPGLIHDEMHNWSRYLHREAIVAGLDILDSHDLSIQQSVGRLTEFLTQRNLLKVCPLKSWFPATSFGWRQKRRR